MMPRRNHPSRRGPLIPARAERTRALYLRDTCGKLRFPSYRAAARISGRAQAEYGPDNGDHTIYRCRWNGGWHLSSLTRAESDARRAYHHHHREEALMPRPNTWRPAIPKDLRPLLIERVRQLNAEGMPDVDIAPLLGYSSKTISDLRREGGIPAIAGVRGSIERAAAPRPTEVDCPHCALFVTIKAGVIEDHNMLVAGQLGRGGVNGYRVQAVSRCPASGSQYAEDGEMARAAA